MPDGTRICSNNLRTQYKLALIIIIIKGVRSPLLLLPSPPYPSRGKSTGKPANEHSSECVVVAVRVNKPFTIYLRILMVAFDNDTRRRMYSK